MNIELLEVKGASSGFGDLGIGGKGHSVIVSGKGMGNVEGDLIGAGDGSCYRSQSIGDDSLDILSGGIGNNVGIDEFKGRAS